MAFAQYAATQVYKVHGEDELVAMGRFKTSFHLELAHIVARLFKRGEAGGTERFRINLYSDAAMTRLIASSSWIELADAVGDADNWQGRVRFDFQRQHINKNSRYYAGIEADNYVPDGETFYCAWGWDYPDPINNNVDAPYYALEMAIYGYRTLEPV